MKANVPNDRLVPVEIVGRECYFNFSLRAAKEMMKMAKSADDAIKTAGEAEDIGAMAGMYALLLQEGARYAKLAYGEDVFSPSAEDLETLLSLKAMAELQGKFSEAVKLGSGREIEVADPKNAKTAQGK